MCIRDSVIGAVDFSSLSDTRIIAFPRILPYKPEFNIGAIVSVALIYLVSAAETIGDTSVISAAVLKRPATDKEISLSLIHISCVIRV